MDLAGNLGTCHDKMFVLNSKFSTKAIKLDFNEPFKVLMYICLEKTIFIINIAGKEHAIFIDVVTDISGPHW